jgi:cytochrome c553
VHKMLTAMLAIVSLLGMTEHANAADVNMGKAKAAQCMACHGMNGIATAPDAPNLAGQNESYLVEQLSAFRSGGRQNDTMSLVAKPLSDADIANLAAYYHSVSAK